MSRLDTLTDEVAYFTDSGRGKPLLVVSASSFLLIGVQMIYPVLLPEMRQSYGFNLTTAGLLISVLWLANAAGQIPGGIVADRFGEASTLLGAVAVATTTVILVLLSDSTLLLFGVTALLGLALGLFGVARYTVMKDFFPERVGTAVGIVLAAADGGQMLLPPAASFIAATAVWQFGFAFTLPLFGVVAVGIWAFVPDPEPDTASSEGLSVDEIGRALSGMRTRSIGYGTALFVLYVCLWVGFTSLYPTYLVEVKGLSQPFAAVLFGAFFAVGVVMKPLSGSAYDRFGVGRTALAIAGVSGLALAALPMVVAPASIVVVTVLVAPILGSGAISQSYLIENLSDDIRGTGLGLVRTGTLAVAAAIPLLFGVTADAGLFDEIFFALAALAGLMILVSIRILRGE